MQTWNVNVQRELWRNFSAMVGYFGSKGDYLRVSRNLNQFLATASRRPTRASSRDQPHPAQLRRSATSRRSRASGYSHYNGDVGHALNQRFSNGLQFNGSYTLSKSKDTNSLNSQNVVVQDSTNIAGDYALSDYDAEHRYVLSAIWELPFKGNRLVEGWQVGVVTAGARPATRSTIVTNLNFTGNANIRPDQLSEDRRGRAAQPVVLDGQSATRGSPDLLRRWVGARPFPSRGQPLRQPARNARHRPGLLQHRPVRS